MGVDARLSLDATIVRVFCFWREPLDNSAEVSFKEVELSDARLSPQCENESLFFGGSDKQTGIKIKYSCKRLRKVRVEYSADF